MSHDCMQQDWDDLAMVHWRMPAPELERRLPPGLTADTYDGAAWISAVPFRLTIRALRHAPALGPFSEVNLRTYVRGPLGPGIWFFSLEAPGRPAVWGGRILYGLPYRRAETSQLAAGALRVYASRARSGPAGFGLALELAGDRPEDDLDVFLTERYLMYSSWLGRLWASRVRHPRWAMHAADVVRCEETLCAAAGLERRRGVPERAHHSERMRALFDWPRVVPASRLRNSA
ncbi:MAG TPA: DUF2071 domain-containing protein [Candidatus Dormibacteraeota bacterium]